MTTRRENLPSHPNRIERARALVRERDVTTTDVTQHATEVLTDQDFLITSPSSGDMLQYNGAKWVNVSSISFPSSGTFGGLLKVDYTGTPMLRMTNDANTDLSWDLRVADTSGILEIRSITDAGTPVANAINVAHATGFTTFNNGVQTSGGPQGLLLKSDGSNDHVYISFYARDSAPTTRSGYLGYPSSGSTTLAMNNEVGSLYFYGESNNRFRVTADQAQFYGGTTSFPAISFWSDPDTGFMWNSSGLISYVANTSVVISFSPTYLSTRVPILVNDFSATGNPYIALYQNGTLGAYVQFLDSGAKLRFASDQSGGWDFYDSTNGAVVVITNAGQATFDGNVIATGLEVNSALGGEIIKIKDTGGAGTAANPVMSFYDSASARLGYIGFGSTVSNDCYILNDTTTGRIFLSTETDNVAILNVTSATSSPYISFSQNGTRRAYVQFLDSGAKLRFASEQSGGWDFYDSTNGAVVVITNAGQATFDGDVIATV